MDGRIEQLRSRLRPLTRGKAPTSIRYPPAVRAEILGLAQQAQAAGISRGRLAADLGLPRWTITRWQRRAPRRPLRRIAIGREPAASGPPPARPGLVLVTPQGWRIEGLDLDTLLRVLALRG
jgi:hypothetical protein